ncbi:MAG: hypothetical protein KGL35_17135, partial [Bradyrhizobium sp.]|nr:hypothetical protein [Bradyrhizobium sp.]
MSAENDKPDDLRSLLSASFDDNMASTAIASGTVDAPVSKPEAADAPKEAGAAGDAPARGTDGKFTKKEDAEAQPAVKADEKIVDKDAQPKPAEKADAQSSEKTENGAIASKDGGRDAPANWSASDKAMFKLQSPDAQDFLLRRHKAMEADYTKKVEAVADLRKEFEPIQQMFAPHLDILKQKGMTPQAVIKAWANVETALANGRGVDVIAGIVQSYGVDKAKLANALGFTSSHAAQPATDAATAPADTAHLAAAGTQPIQLPPELQRELADLRAAIEAQKTERTTAQMQALRDREAKVESDITTFKSAVNDKGELLHPYFEEVEPAMVALASSYVASKQPLPPLPELYETAVWANPSTRAAVLAAQKAAEQTRANEEARAKAASARKAASSVTGAPGSGQATRAIRGDMSLR